MAAALLALAVIALASPPLSAQTFDPAKDVSVELLASTDGLPAGGSADLALVFKVPAGYHIASLESGNFWVEFDTTSPGLKFAAAQFPKGHTFRDEEVFGPQVVVRSHVEALKDLAQGPHTIKAAVGYQICTETGAYQCFMPVEKEVSLSLPILAAGASVRAAHSALFASAEEPPKTSPSEQTPITGKETPKQAVEVVGMQTPAQTTVLAETAQVSAATLPEVKAKPADKGLVGSLEAALARGSFLALFLVFIGGILSSFTPCVYPVIPITISYIGGQSQGKGKASGFFLSLFFVLGLAIMYSSLGIIAALTGGVFGGLTQNPIVYGVLIVIFIAMGASMMGAFDLQLPASWQGKMQGGQKKGALGAMAMGAASGLIAAPCVGPILVALLTWVAKTGSVVVGFGLLFSYSVGMGMLFIVIGTFAGALTALPQAGGWMDSVKHFFGWLLWGTAIFFAGLILPKSIMPLLWGAYLTLLGTYVGAFKPFSEPHTWGWTLGKWAGSLAVVGGIFFFVLGLSQITGWPNVSNAPTASGIQPTSSQVATASLSGSPTAPAWIVNDEPGAFARAAAEGKPVMMDFYADWCAACKELDHETYNQTEIISRSAGFISLKMDFTKQNDWSKQMIKKYGVAGMPTVIFFSADGKEKERFTGFKEAAEVAQIMDRVK